MNLLSTERAFIIRTNGTFDTFTTEPEAKALKTKTSSQCEYDMIYSV